MVTMPYSFRDRRLVIGGNFVDEVAGGCSGYHTEKDSLFWILMSGLLQMFRSVAVST